METATPLKDPVGGTNGLSNPLKNVADPPKAGAVKEECPVIAPFVKDSPSGNGEVAGDSGDLKEVLKEIVYWEQPRLSGKVLLCVLGMYYATLPGGYTPVSLVCYLLALRLVSVSGPRHFAAKIENSERAVVKTTSKLFSKSADAIEEMFPFPSAAQTSFCVKSIAHSIEDSVCSAVKALNKASSDSSYLKVVLAHVVVLMVLTNLFTVWTLLFLCAVGAMTGPVIYSKHHERIDPAVKKIKDKATPYAQKAKAKGVELYNKAMVKGEEAVGVLIAKYQERAAQKETKTD